jgi:hypothetical protein
MPVGHLKLVLLSPGDTLVMRLGYPIAHAVVTLNNSVSPAPQFTGTSELHLSRHTSSPAYSSWLCI